MLGQEIEYEISTRQMQLSRKRTKKIHASYTLEGTIHGTVLEIVENIKYLGVTITNDLRLNTYVSYIWVPEAKLIFLSSRCKRSR